MYDSMDRTIDVVWASSAFYLCLRTLRLFELISNYPWIRRIQVIEGGKLWRSSMGGSCHDPFRHEEIWIDSGSSCLACHRTRIRYNINMHSAKFVHVIPLFDSSATRKFPLPILTIRSRSNIQKSTWLRRRVPICTPSAR